MSYQLVKALHVIFVVSWFAGLFYIFRLFVYHVENWNEPKVCKTFITMEYRLLTYIMLPASILTLTFGVWMLVLNPLLLQQIWIHIKLTFVFFLGCYHLYSYYVFTQFRKGHLLLTSKSCRIINEVPTLILIVVCILAYTKPLFK